MTKTTNQLTLFFFLSFSTIAWGQDLTPQELSRIQNNSDFTSVAKDLADKGFKLHSNETDKTTGKTIAVWSFRPFTSPGEEINSSLEKSVDSNQIAKTTFCLYNPFLYKNFINSLIKSKYKFTGIQIIEGRNYSAFKRKQTVFMTTQRSGLNGPIYEIFMHIE